MYNLYERLSKLEGIMHPDLFYMFESGVHEYTCALHATIVKYMIDANELNVELYSIKDKLYERIQTISEEELYTETHSGAVTMIVEVIVDNIDITSFQHPDDKSEKIVSHDIRAHINIEHIHFTDIDGWVFDLKEHKDEIQKKLNNKYNEI